MCQQFFISFYKSSFLLFDEGVVWEYLHDNKSLYSSNTMDSCLSNGGIDCYSEWFRAGVVKWLDLARLKALSRIKRALELDEVSTLYFNICALDSNIMEVIHSCMYLNLFIPYFA